jgi:hypothetical protein
MSPYASRDSGSSTSFQKVCANPSKTIKRMSTPTRIRARCKLIVPLRSASRSLALADAFDFDELHRIQLSLDHLPQHGLLVRAIHDCLDVSFEGFCSHSSLA